MSYDWKIKKLESFTSNQNIKYIERRMDVLKAIKDMTNSGILISISYNKWCYTKEQYLYELERKNIGGE